MYVAILASSLPRARGARRPLGHVVRCCRRWLRPPLRHLEPGLEQGLAEEETAAAAPQHRGSRGARHRRAPGRAERLDHIGHEGRWHFAQGAWARQWNFNGLGVVLGCQGLGRGIFWSWVFQWLLSIRSRGGISLRGRGGIPLSQELGWHIC